MQCPQDSRTRRHERRRLAVAAGIGSLLAPMLPVQAARAQAAPAPISGAVRDSITGRPLGGAVVQLRDSLDHPVGQGVTDDRGRFFLAGADGARRIRVLHIGFRPAEVPLGSAGGSAAPREVALAPVPPLLAPVRVAAATRCPRGANSAAALGLLEQVRAGLLATVIARTQQPARVTVLSYERRYDARGAGDEASDAAGDDEGAHVERQTVRVRTADGTTAPFGASRTGAEFVADGFRTDDAGRARFYAPDAETLVDDDFVAGYCFRVVSSDGDRPHDVGLGFGAPRRRDGRVDVEGVLWVDTVARTLRDLSFRYVGLEPRVEGLRPGGRLSFREMPTGVAFVDRWSLRLVREGAASAPRRAPRGTSGYESGFERDEPARLEVEAVGGELARAAWPDGRAWRAPLGRWRLRLADAAGRPAAGAEVRLEQTDYAALADSAGVADFPDLLPGPYTASIVDPQLAAAGRGHRVTQRAVVVRDSTVRTAAVVEMAERVVAVQAPTPRPAVQAGIPTEGNTAARTPRDTVAPVEGAKTLDRLFTGRFAGVTVQQASDGGLRILIRGGNPASANDEPLYVVDGTPQPAGTGGVVYLNPYDIEKIEVLKNPQDTGIYGLRGANGVIRITTIRPGRR